jgi:hypothetical protein
MAATSSAAARPGWAGVGIPSTSPKGYHTAAQGQSQMTHPQVLVRAAPGLPCGRAGARSTRCHTAPARKISGDPATPESLVAKHLIENQMFGGRSPVRGRDRRASRYINWHINGHGRPWTSSDVNPRSVSVVAVLLGGGPPGSVLVTRCDSLKIWPLWRAFGLTCPSWLPAPAWPTSWPD